MMSCRPEFLLGGLMLLCWTTVAIVVAALTTWWVMLALVPLLMMVTMGSRMAMTGVMARSAGTDPGAGPWRWCAGWFATRREEEGDEPRRGRASR